LAPNGALIRHQWKW